VAIEDFEEEYLLVTDEDRNATRIIECEYHENIGVWFYNYGVGLCRPLSIYLVLLQDSF
jgi:hypothetical protein